MEVISHVYHLHEGSIVGKHYILVNDICSDESLMVNNVFPSSSDDPLPVAACASAFL